MRTEIFDHLTADEDIIDLVADRVYWDYAPASPTYPYVLLKVTSETPDPTLSGVSSGYRQTTIQADCIGSTANGTGEARDIADAVEARLDGAVIGNMATTVLELSPVEVSNWDGKGTPPLEGWTVEIRIDKD